MPQSEFPQHSPSAAPVFYRTYSRVKEDGTKESLNDTINRTQSGLFRTGRLSTEETMLTLEMHKKSITMPSGRWLWVGGTEYPERPDGAYSVFNCSNVTPDCWEDFGQLMNLLMQGCGAGFFCGDNIKKLPKITNGISLIWDNRAFGSNPSVEETTVTYSRSGVEMSVGDSRRGWCDALVELLKISSDTGGDLTSPITPLYIDLGAVRPPGTPIKGFGGTANPADLPKFFQEIVDRLNSCVGKQLSSLDVSWLICRIGQVVVAGSVRRCLPEGTKVHTAEGLKNIENIQVGDLVQTPFGYRKVVNKFDQGVQSLLAVKTNSRDLVATQNHRVAVLSDVFGSFEWKPLSELSAGDRLLHSLSATSGVTTFLPEKDIVVTEDIAWFIGFLHGNGYVGSGFNNQNGKPWYTVTFASNAQYDFLADLWSRLTKTLDLFCVPATESIVGNTAKLVTTRKSLTDYLEKHFKVAKQPLTIPECVWAASPEVRGAYLAGLMDSDGAVNNRPVHLLDTVYGDFAKDVGKLYASLGIATRHRIVERPKTPKWQTRHDVTLISQRERYNEWVGRFSLKGVLGKQLKDQYAFSVPWEFVKQHFNHADYGKSLCAGKDVIVAGLERLGVNLNHLPVTILGITEAGEAQTWDIEVEDVHCFYAEGYLMHNSALIAQFPQGDTTAQAKSGMWKVDSEGNWSIDPTKDALRMANFTEVFMKKPTMEQCISSVKSQLETGEGAMQYAPEAIARVAGVTDQDDRLEFLQEFEKGLPAARKWLKGYLKESSGKAPTKEYLDHVMQGYKLNPCGEIIGHNFLCNLSEIHANQLEPFDIPEQIKAFRAGAITVCSLLHYKFDYPKMQRSRELDSIIGVSITGLFDFFVNLFGVEWLKWWEAGRPSDWGLQEPVSRCNEIFKDLLAAVVEEGSKGLPWWAQKPEELDKVTISVSEVFSTIEAAYFSLWRGVVNREVTAYCSKHKIKRPNRCTTGQPAGTKSLLTGASPSWHPPKGTRFIRRITFSAYHPVALAGIDYGYTVVPSQSCKDENGLLLNDIHDPRATEWLLEIPTEVPWASLADAAKVNVGNLPIEAQFDFYMQVQQYWTEHNTSATLEANQEDAETLGKLIFNAIDQGKGYISAAILARFHDTQAFPRLPFEPVSGEQYEELQAGVMSRRQSDDFYELMNRYEKYQYVAEGESRAAECTASKCEIKAAIGDKPPVM